MLYCRTTAVSVGEEMGINRDAAHEGHSWEVTLPLLTAPDPLRPGRCFLRSPHHTQNHSRLEQAAHLRATLLPVPLSLAT